MKRGDFKGKILVVLSAVVCFLILRGSAIWASGLQGSSDPSPAPNQMADGLTLTKAVEIALLQNPLIRASVAEGKMAEAKLGEARSSRLPLVQFAETYTYSNNPVFVFGSLLEQSRFTAQNFDIGSLNNPEPISNFRSALILRLPLFNQLQTGTRIDQARFGQEQAEKQKEWVQQRVRFDVIRAYYGVLVAEANDRVAEEAVKMAEADVKRVRDRFETGVVVQADLLAAEVQLAEFRQQQVQAAGDRVSAYAFLNTVLGLPVDSPQEISGQLADRTFTPERPEDLTRLALLHRPDYLKANLTVRTTEKQIHGAQGKYLPRLDVFSTYGLSSKDLTSGSSDYAVGAGLTFNLFDPGRKQKIEQARAAQSLASAEQEHLANQIRLEVIRAYQQFVSAHKRLQLAAQAVKQAEEALRIVRDRYREGLTTITEVLRAQTAQVRTRMNLLAARYENYVGYANLIIASGRLTDVQPFI